MTLLLFFLFTYFITINAFNPVSAPSSGSSTSATHESITRCAIATVTGEYIQTNFGINITPPTVTNGICPQSFFDTLETVFSQIETSSGSSHFEWKLVVDYIIARNAIVDVNEQTAASSHFDSESFVPASQTVLTRYRSAVTSLNAADYENANEFFGKMLHTLQDFYSHSNWIELNNRVPQTDLGVNVMTTAQFAGRTVRTCTACGTDVCTGNVVVAGGLTSGYFKLLFDFPNSKPAGKCSHGGSFDATDDNDATGGINKDTVTSVHGYLHADAAQTAYLATCQILRQFRTEVTDIPFGKFLNIRDRSITTTKTFSFASIKAVISSILDPALGYTSILTNVRKAKSFSVVQQILTLPAIDSFYKSHILAIATEKYISIDILRASSFRQNSFDFAQDLARLTGGLYVYNYNKSQDIINTNTNEKLELIDLKYSQESSNNIAITIDNTCSSILLELVINDTISSLTIQLKQSNQIISPSTIITNTNFYKSYLFSNIPSGSWSLIFSSSIKFKYDLRVSCVTKLRCFSRLYVDNDNSLHPGLLELEGNLIQNKNAYLFTTCSKNNINIEDLTVTMVDETNGNVIGNSIQATYDSNNGRWITNLANIPKQAFRLKYSINQQQIKRLTRMLYQPSLIDVEIIKADTTSKSKTVVQYRLYNYYQKTIEIDFIANNIGTYIKKKDYKLKANEIRDDQIEFDQNSRTNDITANMLALTVTTDDGNDSNYDIISL